MKESARSHPPSPKFLCDHMLGTLARWLRILGFDTSYPGPLEDRDLISLAKRERRLLLTRDKDVGGKRDISSLYIHSDILEEQVSQVLRSLNLTIQKPMSRCPVCNGEVVPVPRSKVAGMVPKGVYDRQKEFWRCPGCSKYYWQGSHWDHIIAKIEDYRSATQQDSRS